jgi:AcrR family transcriptional regulator
MRKPGSHGAERLRTLRSAAIRLLSERGYEGMNLRMLAKRVGVQVGALYNYIDSKQQLLFWLLKEITEKLLAELDLRLNGIDDPEAQMRAFVAFHLGYHIANRKEYWVLLMESRSLSPANYRAISRLQRLYTDNVRGLVERGVASGIFKVKDPQVATFALLQMLSAVIRWYRPNGRLTPDELIEVYTDLILGMLHADDHATMTRAEKAFHPKRADNAELSSGLARRRRGAQSP